MFVKANRFRFDNILLQTVQFLFTKKVIRVVNMSTRNG
jgi:hypothetical protein